MITDQFSSMGPFNETTFREQWIDLLKAYREGDLFAVSSHSLPQTALFESMLFFDRPISRSTRLEMTEAILRWGIDQLSPDGQPDRYSNLWRHYFVLHSYYIGKKRIADVAEMLGIADQTVYEWRSTSLTHLAHVLFQELNTPSDLWGRRQQFILARIDHLDSASVHLLSTIALAQAPLNRSLLFTEDEQAILHDLSAGRWLDLQEDLVSQPEPLQTHLKRILPAPTQSSAHITLYRRFRRLGHAREAIFHAIEGGLHADAVEFVIEQEETLFEEGQPKGISPLLGELVQIGQVASGVSETEWARFMMVAAKGARWEKNIDEALDYSRQALGAPDLETKLSAYYQRAKLLSRVNLDESLSHYEIGFELIERGKNRLEIDTLNAIQPLVARMYIDRAWIYINDRTDFERAKDDLSSAEANVPLTDNVLWSDLYNAQAYLLARSESNTAAIPYHLKALTMALESGELDKMSGRAYNVGIRYMYMKQHQEAETYFQQSLDWAIQSGNVQNQGLAYKGLGGNSFFLEAYEKAVAYYLDAYQIWQTSGYLNWLVSLCYDLAEGYAMLQQFGEGRRYYEEGIKLAQQLDSHRLLDDLAQLKTAFPALAGEMDDRKAVILGYIDSEGGINRAEAMSITGVGKSQVHRDLTEMCEAGLIKRVGAGRSTRYIRI